MDAAFLSADKPLPYRVDPLVVDGTVTVIAGRGGDPAFSRLERHSTTNLRRGLGRRSVGVAREAPRASLEDGFPQGAAEAPRSPVARPDERL
jgi:hypothetical protein